jgi:RNA polymerase sigma-70 factor (ECF subfamily)
MHVDNPRAPGSFRRLVEEMLRNSFPAADEDWIHAEVAAVLTRVADVRSRQARFEQSAPTGGDDAGEPKADDDARAAEETADDEGRRSPLSLADDEGLTTVIEEVIAGGVDAVEHLVNAIRPLVTRYCRARLGRAAGWARSADDVAQEAVLAVVGALPAYRRLGRPFLAFVFGIAAHKVLDAHRVTRQAGFSQAASDEKSRTDDASSAQARYEALSRRLGDLLEKLPPRQREVLILRVVVGLSAEETASAVGSTPGAVRVAQHRALARLRPIVEEAGLLANVAGDDAVSLRAEASEKRSPSQGEVDELLRETHDLLRSESALMSFLLAYA